MISVVFKLWSVMSTATRVFSKFIDIRLAIEPQIRISSYDYTPLKIHFKQKPLPKCRASDTSEYVNMRSKCSNFLQQHIYTIQNFQHLSIWRQTADLDWPRVVVLVRVPSMVQIALFVNCWYYIEYLISYNNVKESLTN